MAFLNPTQSSYCPLARRVIEKEKELVKIKNKAYEKGKKETAKAIFDEIEPVLYHGKKMVIDGREYDDKTVFLLELKKKWGVEE